MMQYICVQPDNIYFRWQVETLINNLLTIGVQPEDINIIMLYEDKPSIES